MSDDFLVGKTINEIRIAQDKKALLFKCADGDHIAKADGDCCSETWVESIEAPAMGFPCVVLSAENLEMPEEEETDDGEYIAYYGLKLTTDKGQIVIDYRNSSNGYYGGELVWPGDYFYGGVFSQNVSDEVWIKPEFS